MVKFLPYLQIAYNGGDDDDSDGDYGINKNYLPIYNWYIAIVILTL